MAPLEREDYLNGYDYHEIWFLLRRKGIEIPRKDQTKAILATKAHALNLDRATVEAFFKQDHDSNGPGNPRLWPKFRNSYIRQGKISRAAESGTNADDGVSKEKNHKATPGGEGAAVAMSKRDQASKDEGYKDSYSGNPEQISGRARSKRQQRKRHKDGPQALSKLPPANEKQEPHDDDEDAATSQTESEKAADLMLLADFEEKKKIWAVEDAANDRPWGNLTGQLRGELEEEWQKLRARDRDRKDFLIDLLGQLNLMKLNEAECEEVSNVLDSED